MGKVLMLVGASAAVVAAAAVLVWFIVFSGLNQPAQFVYGGF